jgi:hypothetical protein
MDLRIILQKEGQSRNKGIELQLNGDIMRNPKGLNWSAYSQYPHR